MRIRLRLRLARPMRICARGAHSSLSCCFAKFRQISSNALVAATKVIIPTEARFFSLQGLQMLEESIEEILYLNPRLEVLGILLSKVDRRLKEERQVADYLRQRWGVRVFTTEVGTNSKILEAGSAGTSVFHYTGADRAVEIG